MVAKQVFGRIFWVEFIRSLGRVPLVFPLVNDGFQEIGAPKMNQVNTAANRLARIVPNPKARFSAPAFSALLYKLGDVVTVGCVWQLLHVNECCCCGVNISLKRFSRDLNSL